MQREWERRRGGMGRRVNPFQCCGSRNWKSSKRERKKSEEKNEDEKQIEICAQMGRRDVQQNNVDQRKRRIRGDANRLKGQGTIQY